jgi:hypothetical protein
MTSFDKYHVIRSGCPLPDLVPPSVSNNCLSESAKEGGGATKRLRELSAVPPSLDVRERDCCV